MSSSASYSSFRIARILSIGLALLAFTGLALTGPALADQTLNGCDFDGDGVKDVARVERNRELVSSSLQDTVRLERRYKGFTCVDTDGDGADELIAMQGRRGSVYAVAQQSSRALARVCKAKRTLLKGEIYKSIASDHITDSRRFSTSFITLRNTQAPRNNCLFVYDRAGNLIHKMGRYFPSGVKYSSRYYGGSGCGDGKRATQVAAIARSNTGSPEIYITSGTGNCARVPDAGRCYNSSAC